MKSSFLVCLCLALLLSCVQENTWQSVPLENGTKAANGSPYKMMVKKGSSNDLIIFFGGGGVVWDDESALKPINFWDFIRHGMEGMGFYFNSVNEGSFSLKGILDTKKVSNPFRSWNAVLIPYATGDFHLGNNLKSYQNSKGAKATLYHNGQINTATSLNWTYEVFKNPQRVFVVGGSAGAFGSSFWLQKIAEHYSSAKIYHLADGGFLESSKWPDVARENWNKDVENFFNIPIEADLIGGAIHANASVLKNVIILQSHSAYDGTLSHFQARINDEVGSRTENVKKWNSKAMKSIQKLSQGHSNYFYYVSDFGKDKNGTTPHTTSSFELFFTMIEDGKSYEEWVTSAVLEDRPYSVGEKFLNP